MYGVGTFALSFIWWCCTEISRFFGLGTFPLFKGTYLLISRFSVKNPSRLQFRDLNPIKQCIMITYWASYTFISYFGRKYATHLDICIDYDLWWLGMYHRNATHVDILFVLLDIWRFLHLLHDVGLWKVSLYIASLISS